MKTIILIIACMAFSTAALAKNPRSLQPINGIQYVLAENYTAQEKAATFTLKAGIYSAKFEDSKAFYLIGAQNCLEMRIVPPKQPEFAHTTLLNCGVYLPKDPAGQALFFYIREALPYNSDAGVLINAIIKNGEGSFKYPISKKFVVDLRPKLHASQP